MPTKVRIRGESSIHTMMLTSADRSLTQAFKDVSFFAMLNLCARGEKSYTRQNLLEIAASLHQQIRDHGAVLSYRYSVQCFYKGIDMGGGRGAGGFTIGGKYHYLLCGPGDCRLILPEHNERGEVIAQQVTDVRDRKQIDTEDWGPIRITRTRLKLHLPEQLEELIAFLNKTPDAQFEVGMLHDRSLNALIRMAHQGDEGAEEELFNGGDPTKQQLLAKLTDKKAAKYRRTIAWVLLTCFPSPDSRSAVERTLESETDPTRQRDLATLLAATPK